MLDDPYFKVLNERFSWIKDARSGWQFGETGIVEKFAELYGDRICHTAIEIGGGDGDVLPLTLATLPSRGWKVSVFEKDDENRAKLEKKYKGQIHLFGEYRTNLQIEDKEPGVLLIDVDSIDGYIMREVLEVCQPSMMVVEHYDLAGPAVAGAVDFWETIPRWLCGMPLDHGKFAIQWPAHALANAACKNGRYTLAAVTRCNSIFIHASLA